MFSFFIVSATLVHGGLQIILLLWSPDPDTPVIYYVIASFWGMGDAVIQTQINGTRDVVLHLCLTVCVCVYVCVCARIVHGQLSWEKCPWANCLGANCSRGTVQGNCLDTFNRSTCV